MGAHPSVVGKGAHVRPFLIHFKPTGFFEGVGDWQQPRFFEVPGEDQQRKEGSWQRLRRVA